MPDKTPLLAAVAATALGCLLSTVPRVDAAVVVGGGNKTTDCMAVVEAPGANHPPPPKSPRGIDCTDGDPSCDADGVRNGECTFGLQICLNSTALTTCVPEAVDGVFVYHAADDGDPKFDTDFQAIALRLLALGLPASGLDECTTPSSIRVALRAPKSGNKYRTNKKKLRFLVTGDVLTKSAVTDKDRIKFKCRPEGDRIYLPADLYTGTFDRIRRQVFAQSCALSSCHDSESAAGGMTLLAGAAYSQIVGVTPANASAAAAGLERILPGDPDLSFLYRKITADLEVGWGSPMPLGSVAPSPATTELIRLWILGDGVLGPAPENGWVLGTDQ